MPELHLPWLEMSVLIPLIGSLSVIMIKNSGSARKFCLLICGITFACAVGEWIDFSSLKTFEAHDHWDLIELVFHKDVFVIDELNAPLLPLVSLLCLLTILSTMKTKVNRFRSVRCWSRKQS